MHSSRERRRGRNRGSFRRRCSRGYAALSARFAALSALSRVVCAPRVVGGIVFTCVRRRGWLCLQLRGSFDHARRADNAAKRADNARSADNAAKPQLRHGADPVQHLPGERRGDQDDEGDVIGEEFASHVRSTPGMVVTNSAPKNFAGVKLPGRLGEERSRSTAASALRTVNA